MTEASKAAGALLRISVGLSVFGLGATVVMLVLGFETPHTGLLRLSAFCVFSTPLAVLVHLAATTDLTNSQKRIWLRALLGRKAPWAFAEYLRTADRGAIADVLGKVVK
jgi:hypothetical protein